MPHQKSKRSNDLVFIQLESFSFFRDAAIEAGLSLSQLTLLKHPQKWSGEDMTYKQLMDEIGLLAESYAWRRDPAEGENGHLMISGGEAFGIIHYALEQALCSAHSLKAVQETMPLLGDLQDLLKSRWAYEGHKTLAIDKLEARYLWSATMSAQRVLEKQVTLHLAENQKKRLRRTAESVINTYSDLMPEFASSMAEAHIMRLGGNFGEKIARTEAVLSPI